MSRTIKISADGEFSRPADNTAYAVGDEISNSATAGSVVRATFNLSGIPRGLIKHLTIGVTPAAGNLVITALVLEASLFKTADAPAAVGDNVTNPLAATVTRKRVGRLVTSATAWLNQLGAVTAGTSGIQHVEAQLGGVAGDVFEFKGGEIEELTLVLRAAGTWTPTGVANAFTFDLEIETEY